MNLDPNDWLYTENTIQAMIANVLDSKKYRHAGINSMTIEALIRQEAPHHNTQKDTLKAVKRKLHNIVAPYLGDPDYPALLEELSQIEDASLTSPSLKAFCTDVLSQHASTAERIPLMLHFYDQLFSVTGQPHTLLDLACGLHPIAFPWMGLPISVQYHGFDIIQPRIDFINQFFIKIGLAPLAVNQDILVQPPTFHADLAIFFKEAHRFEKRQAGCNRSFLESLNVDKLAISLPSQNLAGTHSLLDGQRALVYDNLPSHRKISEILFKNEIIFIIEKNGTS